jgi:hypothetical protein
MQLTLEYVINNLFKKDLTLLYGDNTSVTVESVKFMTNNKKYMIDCRLHVGVIYESELEFTYPSGLSNIVMKSCRVMGLNPQDYLISSQII